ncbi:transposase [Lutispora saccharofermentans]|uniref:Transposase n=1 Tax=Lutispora saccharofermentans TaxID=3024236 RepID=A0ABT1NC52_9FIRM|nr:transposase [Lutispora saccharofermentans]MCQ1528839.1 transposase [Lutispora saccharofermentans]
MGRPWREEYKGGIYHVIARGNNKEYIFKESIDKGYFIKQLKESIEGMNYRIFGYILMDNHYHILIQTMDKKLQEIMHQINNKYSKYFNAKYKRVGHVFQGRYKAILVQDERYLIWVLRYIHQNPVQAGICETVSGYKWSSDVFYRRGIKGFVNVDIVLNMLAADRNKAVKKYMELMSEREEKDYEKEKIIGDEAYQLMCLSRRKTEERKRLDEILIETGISEEDYVLVKSGSRKRRLTQYKLEYARAALALRYTYKEIAHNINITESSVKDLIYRNESKSK